MAAQKRMKEARGVTARITVEIPADLDEFLTVQRSKRDPVTGYKVKNHMIITAALDLLKQKITDDAYDYLGELRKKQELPLK